MTTNCKVGKQLATVELNASLFSVRVIAVTKTAVYVRLPKELQERIECSCDVCKNDPTKQCWDTLVVPMRDCGTYCETHTHRVHMPDESVEKFKDYMRRVELNEAND